MQIKSKIITITILLFFLFPSWNAFPFSNQENPLAKAIQLFDKQKFQEAELAFKKLIDDRPDDFMINYFYGACRTENGHYGSKELNLLLLASKEVYPLDIDYYFGVQYHAMNQWDKALSHYKTYKKVASEEEMKRVQLSEKIDECTNKINPFVQVESIEEQKVDTLIVADEAGIKSNEINDEVLDIVPAQVAVPATEIVAVQLEENGDTLKIVPEAATDSIIGDKIQNVELESNPEEIGTVSMPKPAEKEINFNINRQITYLFESNFKTSEGGIYYKEGVSKQTDLNKLIGETEMQRAKYSASKTSNDRDSIGKIIVDLESQTYDLSNVVNRLFIQAKSAENAYWQSVPPEEGEKFVMAMEEESKKINKAEVDESVIEIPSKILIVNIDDEQNQTETPKPATKPSGVTYKIQLWAFSKGIPAKVKPLYTKISLIRKIDTYTDDKGVVVYTTGNLTKYEDASVMLTQVTQEGVKDAMIAAYLNGKRIPLEQARETEKKK